VTDAVLVVGYGNPLRSDDGLGWHAAGLLAGDPRLDGVTVLQRHQLTPELAFDMSTAARVVFVDATRNRPPGTFTMGRVELAGDGPSTTWSHHLSPSCLVALAYELYGSAPDVFVLSCGTESLDVGDRLSPTVEAALPRVVDAVAEFVASHVAHAAAEHRDA
jgi:hydrogenase maturation protease